MPNLERVSLDIKLCDELISEIYPFPSVIAFGRIINIDLPTCDPLS